MCDVFAAIGVKDGDRLRDFMKEAAPKMKGFRNEHGIGYTAISKSGNIFGERWLDPKQAFTGNPITESDKLIVKQLAPAMDEVPNIECYNNFGQQRWGDVTAAIYHARFATCEKSMDNVHPFNRGLTSLIHNGVIRNADELENITSTCDSEGILNQYLRREVNINSQNIQKLFQDLEGAFTVMATTTDAEGNRVIDIFKDNGRMLYVTMIDQLGGIVFTSNKDVVIDTCKKLNWTHKNMLTKVKDHVFMRFNPITGLLVGDVIKCEPRRSEKSTSNKQTKNQRKYNNYGYWDPVLNKFIKWEDSEDDEYDWYTGVSSGKASGGVNKQQTKEETKSNNNSTTQKQEIEERQKQNRKVLDEFLDKRKTGTNVVGSVDVSGVCNVAQFLANEKHHNLTGIDDDNTEDVHDESEEVTGNIKESPLLEELLPEMEASDSKYGSSFNSMSVKDLETLEAYAEELGEEEREALDELPDEMKFVYLKRRYNKDFGNL